MGRAPERWRLASEPPPVPRRGRGDGGLVRSFQLVIAVGVLLSSIWFLWRLLPGRWVAAIRPASYRER